MLFWALDRFSREGTMKTYGYLQQLDSYDVLFHSYTEPYISSDNEMVRDISLTVMASMAKHTLGVNARARELAVQKITSGKPEWVEKSLPR